MTLVSNTESAVFAQYSEGEKCKTANIQIQGTPVNYNNSSFFFFREIMIPVMETLDKIGIQATWNSGTNQLIVYDNNIFIKLMQNDFSILINGKKSDMSVPAVLYEGVLYAPANDLLNALDISHEIIGNTLHINYREFQGETAEISSVQYRRIMLFRYGVDLLIPTNLTAKNDVFQSEIGKYTLEIMDKNGLHLDVEPEDLTLNGFVLFRETKEEEVHNYYVHNEKDLVLHFINFNPEMEQNIVKSVNTNAQIPNVKLEHYYEFPDFHLYRTQLANPIFSNMTMSNYIDFSGSIETEGQFEILVSRDNEFYKYPVAITDGQFTGKIRLPFGAGKHNISIKLFHESGEKDFLIFSAINTSDQIQKDLVPTIYLDFDNPVIKSAFVKIGYRGINQKSTSELIYRWITSQFKLNLELNTTRKLSKILEEHETVRDLSPQEACILYAGMLRATGIPAKIAMKKSSRHYWVEAYLNGGWKMMGIVNDLRYGTFFYFYKSIYETNAEYLEY